MDVESVIATLQLDELVGALCAAGFQQAWNRDHSKWDLTWQACRDLVDTDPERAQQFRAVRRRLEEAELPHGADGARDAAVALLLSMLASAAGATPDDTALLGEPWRLANQVRADLRAAGPEAEARAAERLPHFSGDLADLTGLVE
jgi:hypothetical protein